MRKFLVAFISSALIISSLAFVSTEASALSTATTCTNLSTGRTSLLKDLVGKCRNQFASANWIQEQSDTPARFGEGYATLTVCSSRNPLFTYKLIRESCPKFQVTTSYWRAVAKPQTPIIEEVYARGHDSASIRIKVIGQSASAPIAYFLVRDTKSGTVSRVAPGNLGIVHISGLSAESSYSFTVTAVNVDGISEQSQATSSIRTGPAPVTASISPATCATGGTCSVGDIGPGGGLIFYVLSSGFSCGTSGSNTCKYLEAAPKTWSGAAADGTGYWCQDDALISGTQTAIGTGKANNDLLVTHCSGQSAAKTVALLSLGGKSDWFIPSSAEAYQFYVQRNLFVGDYEFSGDSINTDPTRYVTSSQDRSPGSPLNFQYIKWFSGAIEGGWKAYNGFPVRPIRAF